MAELHADTTAHPRSKAVPATAVKSVALPPEAVAKASAKRRPVELIARAKDQLCDLTGYSVDSVSGFEKADSGWHLAVTVVELHRIPAATDVLANYEVDLNEGGDIVSYHRGKRYFRDQVGDET